MNFDTKTAAGYAADKLDSLLERAQRDTTEVVQTEDIPKTVAHFAALPIRRRTRRQSGARCRSTSIVSATRQSPTLFMNHNVKTITVDDVGRVSINVRWRRVYARQVQGAGVAKDFWQRRLNSGKL